MERDDLEVGFASEVVGNSVVDIEDGGAENNSGL